MKLVLLEIVLVMEAIIFWALALPAAAIFFVFALLWKKASAIAPSEPFDPATPRLSRASA